jgi:N-acetyl-gamma-glutamyl-phosphate reductase
MITVAVAGASGYTGAEVLRWCLMHPRLQVVGATSRQHAGKTLDQLWPAFAGHPIPITEAIPDADALFLCLPHGEAARLAPTLSHRIVIDLSGDHRLKEPAHTAAYGFSRQSPAWHYGLPELGVPAGVTRIANPGCFATALELALLPMKDQLPQRVAAVGLTGSTGSGAQPGEGTHHPSRAENLRPYKVLAHQHIPEVLQALNSSAALDFVPISAPIRRGILVTAFLPGACLKDYQAFYNQNPLVQVQNRPPELHTVLGSPRAAIGVVEGEQAAVFCAIDNLCRGAGSQAVANLNLAMGWPMDLGLTSIPPVP